MKLGLGSVHCGVLSLNLSQDVTLLTFQLLKTTGFVEGDPAMTLTKASIIEMIADENGWSQKQSSEYVELLLEIIYPKFNCREANHNRWTSYEGES